MLLQLISLPATSQQAARGRTLLLVAAAGVVCAAYWAVRRRQPRRGSRSVNRAAGERANPLTLARLRWQLKHGLIEQIENTSLFASQVAGHSEEVLRQLGNHFVLKPLYVPDKTQREVGFYEDVMSTDPAYDWQNPSQFIPAYYGAVPVRMDSRITSFLVLENLCQGLHKVCAMDVKLGKRTFSATATAEKRKLEMAKYPYQQELGFRISGMKVFDAVEQTYWRAGKKFGRSLTPERVVDGLAVFFCNGSRMRGEVISATLSQLYRIKAWADRQTRYTFVSASVLIVYDGEPTSLPMSQQDLVRVKLIDFAQTTKATDTERSFAFGLKRLIEHLHLLQHAIKTQKPLPMFAGFEHLQQSLQ